MRTKESDLHMTSWALTWWTGSLSPLSLSQLTCEGKARAGSCLHFLCMTIYRYILTRASLCILFSFWYLCSWSGLWALRPWISEFTKPIKLNSLNTKPMSLRTPPPPLPQLQSPQGHHHQKSGTSWFFLWLTPLLLSVSKSYQFCHKYRSYNYRQISGLSTLLLSSLLPPSECKPRTCSFRSPREPFFTLALL